MQEVSVNSSTERHSCLVWHMQRATEFQDTSCHSSGLAQYAKHILQALIEILIFYCGHLFTTVQKEPLTLHAFIGLLWWQRLLAVKVAMRSIQKACDPKKDGNLYDSTRLWYSIIATVEPSRPAIHGSKTLGEKKGSSFLENLYTACVRCFLFKSKIFPVVPRT